MRPGRSRCPARLIQPGVAGVKANVIATATEAAGHLKLFSAASALRGLLLGELRDRRHHRQRAHRGGVGRAPIKIYSSKKAHVVVDVTATIS